MLHLHLPLNHACVFQDGSFTKKLPGKLQSAHIKASLSENIVQPLLQDGLNYLTFRLMWTNKDNHAEAVWKYITQYQQGLCEQIKMMPGVVFFISSITATVTMATRTVHPGIAFWIATDPNIVKEYQIYTALRNNGFGAELKIVTPRNANSEVDRQLQNLSTTVKDFGPGYVQDKMNVVCPQESSQHMRERIYLKSAPKGTSYSTVLFRAQEILSSQGLDFYLEVF